MTTLQERVRNLAIKKLLFEYFVFQLEQWKQEKHPRFHVSFTKLKLQKILFLVASVKSKENTYPLLNVFNRFYALPYGPVEIDIYDAMNDSSFKNISFIGNECQTRFTKESFAELDQSLVLAMTEAIQAIKNMGVDYISMTPFELVDITHKWTSWQVAMQVAEMCNSKREPMSTNDIISSTVKAYK
jgi:uncharacterized phage-associated protein